MVVPKPKVAVVVVKPKERPGVVPLLAPKFNPGVAALLVGAPKFNPRFGCAADEVAAPNEGKVAPKNYT